MTADLDHLGSEGYVVLKGVLGQHLIDQFEDEVDRLAHAQMKARGITASGKDEPMAELYRLGGKYRHLMYTSMQNLAALDAIKVHLLEQHKPGGIFAGLNFDVPVSTCGLRIDLPHEDNFLERVHQDYSCFAPPGFHAWVPMRRVDEHHGSVRFWPGSHKGGFVPHNTDNPRQPFIEPEHYEGRPSIVAELDPGDVLFFNIFGFHRSVPNRSDVIRYIGIFMMQDLARLQDPEDRNSSVWDMVSMTATRQAKNKEAATA
ncbi:MAG: phytanoyl-CoA dioxygenase family protein [Alphaproteobacteria bacterium]